MPNQLADYEVVGVVADDGALLCLQVRLPARLGGGNGAIWGLGPLARTPWTAALARLEPVAGVRGDSLPAWLETGVGEWAQRPVVWVSASTTVTGTLAAPPAGTDYATRLRALASAARAAHALHESGQLHGAICPQAITLTAPASLAGGPGPTTAVLAPPSLADGWRPLAQIGYPPLAYIDPQLLRGAGGRWSDIWALGATTQQVLTGSVPFPGIEEVPVVQALAQLLTAPAPARPDLPPLVAALVGACLAVDPADRPPTAAEVAARLDEAAASS